MLFHKNNLTGVFLLCLFGVNAQSNNYGIIELGLGNAYYEGGSGQHSSNDFPMLTLSSGYFKSINKDFSIGVQVPGSLFSIKNIYDAALQLGGFAIAYFGSGASMETPSHFGFFIGPGILWHYTERNYDKWSDPYIKKSRMIGIAYQAGFRFGSKSNPTEAFAIHFTYSTDFKAAEKRLYDIKITYSGIYR